MKKENKINKEELKLKSDKIRERNKKIRRVKIALLIMTLFLIIIYFLLRVVYATGNFTVSLDPNFAKKQRINYVWKAWGERRQESAWGNKIRIYG